MKTPSSPRSSILIVEDEPIVAKDLQLTLRDLGYDSFAIAASADEALKRAAERCPDLVLMDIRIKGPLDGIQTADLLRRRFGVAVVYLTAHADEATIERATSTEPYGYLLKPIKADELRSAVEVTMHKQRLDKAMRERERWLATAVRSVHDAVLTTDAAGNVTFMNPAAEAITGMEVGTALGRNVDELLGLLAKDSLVAQTMTLADADAPGAGPRRGSVVVLHDVSEQKRLQKQLELSDRLHSLGAMAASTAHELNNPLAIVMTNAGIIAESVANVRRSLGESNLATISPRLVSIDGALGDLQAAASRMARIIGDLRTFSRPSDAAPTLVDLRRCVEWAVRATAHEFRSRARILTRFDPAPAIIGEAARIEQVLVNLLVNAAHAITPGNVDANEVQVAVRTAEDGRALIQVRDTGRGIDDRTLGKIFDPFFTTKEAGVGTGLGLAICQGIVKALGGEIRVASELGKGTVFTILLSAASPDHAPVIEAPAVAEPPSRRGRLLIIDDEVTLLRAMQRILEDDGHEVVVRDNARDGLALLDQGEAFDLIISDMMMPSMTGVDFYEALIQRHPDTVAKVAFVTGGAITSQVAAFLESIQNPRLEKPFKVAQLCDLVRRALGPGASPAAQHVPAPPR